MVGGGLAGMAAACRLAESGLDVELFEARDRLGGRASSFRDPQHGFWLDPCQHVWMGCCAAFADFCRRAGLSDCFRRYDRLHVIGPDGRRFDIAPHPWLPAPLHVLPSLLGLRYLGFPDRLRIARAMLHLAACPATGPDEPTMAAWLLRQNQSPEAIRTFWSVLLQSALAEPAEQVSLAAGRKVIVEGLLASRQAMELEIPRLPLAEIFDRRAGAWLAQQGVAVHRGTRVKQIQGDAAGATGLLLSDGTQRRFDGFVAAVPWHQVGRLLAPPVLQAVPALAGAAQIPAVPITALHLWFDRAVADLAQAVLVGRLGQWVFCRKADWPEPASGPGPLHYHQVVISGVHEFRYRPAKELLARVCAELAAIWPAAGRGRLVHWRLVRRPRAVFSVRPGTERLRPSQRTPVANLALAGDWTATGWPATMEGAVRSGYLAAMTIVDLARSTGRLEADKARIMPPNGLEPR